LVCRLYEITPGEPAGFDVDGCIQLIVVVGCGCWNVLEKVDNVDEESKQCRHWRKMVRP